MQASCDFLVIGAGIAGASAAFELVSRRDAKRARIVLLEREDVAGYHSTGRSVAVLTSSHGLPVVQALAEASRPFLESPPAGFAGHPLLAPRGVLRVVEAAQKPLAQALYSRCQGRVPGVRLLDGAGAAAMHPALDPEATAAAVLEPGAMDMDVNAIHQGYLKGFRSHGGTIATGADVRGLEMRDGRWRVQTTAGDFAARVVINAAGAWADEVARLAGLEPLGLVAKRRTVIAFDCPDGFECDRWPMVVDIGGSYYFKLEAGRILASPADETPTPPCDARPEERDVAVAADRIEKATRLRIARITRKWAGLRSFFPDSLPVVGSDPRIEGFFWLAGQGGNGINTAPALACFAAALIAGSAAPPELAELGVTAADLAPERLIRPAD